MGKLIEIKFLIGCFLIGLVVFNITLKIGFVCSPWNLFILNELEEFLAEFQAEFLAEFQAEF